MRKILFSAFAAALTASVAVPAFAAPQILAVMASLGAQEMRCSGSICTTSFTTYCLQRERDVPTTGQAYLPAAPEHFTLSIIAEDGTETPLAAGEHVSFRSQRGYSAVVATIGRQELAQLGGVAARIVTSERAALLPVPEANDPNPITEAEIAYATQSLREHGEEIVDATPDGQAAAIVNRMATTIVPSAPANADSLKQLWHDVIDGLGPAHPIGQDAIKRARDIYDWCQTRMSYHSMGGIKSCLEFKHDNTIMRLNREYWESQPGY